ncbi:MAG: hypothetical protein ACWGQW_04665 [bacterium]
MAEMSIIKKSARQVAEEELAAELAKTNVAKYKTLLRQKHDTEIILRNIERQIAELEHEEAAGLSK